ncbi:hypothetical protein [Streptomyces sp. C10-9-1]|uniref:hypothetical protein n=1 Tax=Streptomyces sp. C10-9-1 TaxID=1859285 RepID=UPI003D71777C
MPDTLDLRALIAAMLRAGATYAQVCAELGASLNLIATVRREHSIPVAEGRPFSLGKHAGPRGMADGFAAGTTDAGNGHVRCSNASRFVYYDNTHDTARRVAFRLAHGREPVGLVTASCGEPWCVAPGHAEDRPMRGQLRLRIAAMLRAGATYAQVRAELGAGSSTVASVRREYSIPVVAGRAFAPRTMAEAYARHAEDTGDGHVRWTGPWNQVPTPVVNFGRGQDTVRRVAFRLAYGREPVGPVTSGCGEPWCVAPGHGEDRPMREQLRAQLEAIGGPRA